MFTKAVLLVTLVLCSSIQSQYSLTDPKLIASIVGPQYAASAAAIQQRLSSNPAVQSVTNTKNATTQTQTVNQVRPQVLPTNGGVTGRYNPYLTAVNQAVANMQKTNTNTNTSTNNANTQIKPTIVQPKTTSGSISNPFTSASKTYKSQIQTVNFQVDLNAMPIFHPPVERKVPATPHYAGSHWYTYKASNVF